MNRRELLTGAAALLVPLPSMPAPFTVNCAGRVGGIRAGAFISRGSVLMRMPDGTYRVCGALDDVVITGTVTV